MDYEIKIADLEIEVPAWIDQDIDVVTVESIIQGGCDSGAYMPAVTYYTALRTMSEHGDDVLAYIEEVMGEIPQVKADSWTGLAVKYLSIAVELWADSVYHEIEEIEE